MNRTFWLSAAIFFLFLQLYVQDPTEFSLNSVLFTLGLAACSSALALLVTTAISVISFLQHFLRSTADTGAVHDRVVRW